MYNKNLIKSFGRLEVPVLAIRRFVLIAAVVLMGNSGPLFAQVTGKAIQAAPLPQLQNMPWYKMNFTYTMPNGEVKDVHMPRIQYRFWSKSESYPKYVKWKDQPFAVLKSPINGVGLFTDSVSAFKKGDVIGVAFYKLRVTGVFQFDYVQSDLGSFVNDSQDPNMEVVATRDGLMMKAIKDIAPNTELTASYRQLLALFPGDDTAKRLIKYW